MKTAYSVSVPPPKRTASGAGFIDALSVRYLTWISNN